MSELSVLGAAELAALAYVSPAPHGQLEFFWGDLHRGCVASKKELYLQEGPNAAAYCENRLKEPYIWPVSGLIYGA